MSDPITGSQPRGLGRGLSRLAAVESRRGWAVFGLVLTLALVLVPVLNQGLPPDSPAHLPNYMVSLFGKYLCFALLALSLDLVWGYTGALSLGHGAFFALGGYCMGMYLMRQIGSRGVYGNAGLPDFMVFLNWHELPWYWLGFDRFGFAMLMAMLAPGLLALVLGWFAFNSRITGVYFSIITQAMVFALMLAFFRNEMGFGGNNGLTDFKEIIGCDLQDQRTRVGLYLASVLLLALGWLICRFITRSRLGRVMIAIRDAESRVRFLGYRVAEVKLFAFVVSAVLAGLAGALYVPQVGIVNPGEFLPAGSIEIAIWVAVGGRGTLIGAPLGALAVNGAKSYFTGAAPELWSFALGALFILVTLLLPHGLVGVVAAARARLVRRPPAALREGRHHA
ncbi:MAG: urea ABC transporter permease subunit UrtC [Rhodospirillaceae bacterium]